MEGYGGASFARDGQRGLPFHHANIVIINEISPTSNFFPLFSQNNSSYNVVVAAVSYK
jgi:hypothetical protein